MEKKEYVVNFADCRIWAKTREEAIMRVERLIKHGGFIKFDVMKTDAKSREKICEFCGKPWNSEFHASDECINPDEDAGKER